MPGRDSEFEASPAGGESITGEEDGGIVGKADLLDSSFIKGPKLEVAMTSCISSVPSDSYSGDDEQGILGEVEDISRPYEP